MSWATKQSCGRDLQCKSSQNKTLVPLLCGAQVINPGPQPQFVSTLSLRVPRLQRVSVFVNLRQEGLVYRSVWPGTLCLTSCSVMSKSLIICYLFPFPCLPAKWNRPPSHCEAPPPLPDFDLCLPYEQSSLQVLSCVSLVFRLQSFSQRFADFAAASLFCPSPPPHLRKGEQTNFHFS